MDEWVQSELLGKLPEQLRVTPFSFDVALLADGSLRMIESNPGGNSGFLGLKGKNIRALNEFLKHYPERLRRGELYEGLSPEEQMNYLVELFSKFGIRTEVHYPGIEFLPSQMFDPEFPQRKPSPTKWQQEGKRVCQSFLLAV